MTEAIVNLPSQFLSEGFRALRITGLFRILLRDHFSNPNAITSKALQSRVWADGDNTGILVEDYTVWTPGRAGKRPAIIIKRNALTSIKRGISNRAGTTSTGHPQYCKFWKGSHTLFCTGKEGAEAEVLAYEVYRYLMHMGPAIRHVFNFHMLEVAAVGELSQIKEAQQRFTVPVTVAYAAQEYWTLRNLNAPWLKTVQFTADASPYDNSEDTAVTPGIKLTFG